MFWFGKRGSWYVITSETHWITMHNRNMYIYTHTNMFVHVNSKNKMFYQSWKETDLCVHTNMFCSDHAILGFPLLRVPCQCSLVPSDLNNWFRASFLFILSCLLCLFWLKLKTEKNDDSCMFLRAKVAMACQSSGIWTVRPSWCILPSWGRMCP